jgi:hypothetical protein
MLGSASGGFRRQTQYCEYIRRARSCFGGVKRCSEAFSRIRGVFRVVGPTVECSMSVHGWIRSLSCAKTLSTSLGPPVCFLFFYFTNSFLGTDLNYSEEERTTRMPTTTTTNIPAPSTPNHGHEQLLAGWKQEQGDGTQEMRMRTGG